MPSIRQFVTATLILTAIISIGYLRHANAEDPTTTRCEIIYLTPDEMNKCCEDDKTGIGCGGGTNFSGVFAYHSNIDTGLFQVVYGPGSRKLYIAPYYSKAPSEKTTATKKCKDEDGDGGYSDFHEYAFYKKCGDNDATDDSVDDSDDFSIEYSENSCFLRGSAAYPGIKASVLNKFIKGEAGEGFPADPNSNNCTILIKSSKEDDSTQAFINVVNFKDSSDKKVGIAVDEKIDLGGSDPLWFNYCKSENFGDQCVQTKVAAGADLEFYIPGSFYTDAGNTEVLKIESNVRLSGIRELVVTGGGVFPIKITGTNNEIVGIGSSLEGTKIVGISATKDTDQDAEDPNTPAILFGPASSGNMLRDVGVSSKIKIGGTYNRVVEIKDGSYVEKDVDLIDIVIDPDAKFANGGLAVTEEEDGTKKIDRPVPEIYNIADLICVPGKKDGDSPCEKFKLKAIDDAGAEIETGEIPNWTCKSKEKSSVEGCEKRVFTADECKKTGANPACFWVRVPYTELKDEKNSKLDNISYVHVYKVGGVSGEKFESISNYIGLGYRKQNEPEMNMVFKYGSYDAGMNIAITETRPAKAAEPANKLFTSLFSATRGVKGYVKPKFDFIKWFNENKGKKQFDDKKAYDYNPGCNAVKLFDESACSDDSECGDGYKCVNCHCKEKVAPPPPPPDNPEECDGEWTEDDVCIPTEKKEDKKEPVDPPPPPTPTPVACEKGQLNYFGECGFTVSGSVKAKPGCRQSIAAAADPSAFATFSLLLSLLGMMRFYKRK